MSSQLNFQQHIGKVIASAVYWSHYYKMWLRLRLALFLMILKFTEQHTQNIILNIKSYIRVSSPISSDQNAAKYFPVHIKHTWEHLHLWLGISSWPSQLVLFPEEHFGSNSPEGHDLLCIQGQLKWSPYSFFIWIRTCFLRIIDSDLTLCCIRFFQYKFLVILSSWACCIFYHSFPAQNSPSGLSPFPSSLSLGIARMRSVRNLVSHRGHPLT